MCSVCLCRNCVSSRRKKGKKKIVFKDKCGWNQCYQWSNRERRDRKTKTKLWWPPSLPNIESIRMSKRTQWDQPPSPRPVAIYTHNHTESRLNEKSIKTDNGVHWRRVVASFYQTIRDSFFAHRFAELSACEARTKRKIVAIWNRIRSIPYFLGFSFLVKWHWYWSWYFLNRFVCICKISSCVSTTNSWILDESICIIVVVVVHHPIYLCRRGLGSHHRRPEGIGHRCWRRRRVHCPKHVHWNVNNCSSKFVPANGQKLAAKYIRRERYTHGRRNRINELERPLERANWINSVRCAVNLVKP